MRSDTTDRVGHLVDPAVMVRATLVDDLDAGFAELMRTYATVVYSVALHTTGRPADAEDLSSEAFLRAYRALRGYDHARLAVLVPRPWLLSIVINTRRNQVRDDARRPRTGAPNCPTCPQQARAWRTTRRTAPSPTNSLRCWRSHPMPNAPRSCCATSSTCRSAKSPRFSVARLAPRRPTSPAAWACRTSNATCSPRPARSPSITRPYAWVAAEIGRPRAVRAAGSVLARNQVPLLVPCHRVVCSDGTPGRYIFGDDRKQQLLRDEHATASGALGD